MSPLTEFKVKVGIKMNVDIIFDSFPKIETDRFILRKLSPKDREDYFRMYYDEETLLYYDVEPYKTLEQAERTIELMNKWHSEKRYIRWGIVRKDNHQLIGDCGFHSFVKPYSRAEIGYLVSREYWRQGVGTEVLTTIISYAFKDIGLNRIEAQIYPDNRASISLVEKLGFKKEGVLREYEYIRGKCGM
jgi:ribosomal-protein-alanine N-acetyltransferase